MDQQQAQPDEQQQFFKVRTRASNKIISNNLQQRLAPQEQEKQAIIIIDEELESVMIDQQKIKSMRFSSQQLISNEKNTQKFAQSVTCQICLLILHLPYYECQECSNNFCEGCIKNWWIKNQKSCIFRCQQPQFKLIKRSNTYNVILEALRVSCKYCNKQHSISQIETHLLKYCPQVIYRCKFCQKQIKRGDLNEHQNQICESRPIKCKFCQTCYKYKYFTKSHQQCPKQLLPCLNEGCQQKILRKQFESHKKKCEYMVIQCEWCKKQMTKKLYKKHEQTCEGKIISCNWCQKNFVYKDFLDHKCQLKKENCTLCKTQILTKDIKQHKIECMFINMVEIKDTNDKLVVDNIRLREKVAMLQQIIEESIHSRQSTTLNALKKMRLQDKKFIEKDLQRLNYSIKSVQKLKKQEYEKHMKFPHWLGWCPICKEMQKKFDAMLEPLLSSRKQVVLKLSELQRFQMTPK